MNALKDQLLKAGFALPAAAPKPERSAPPKGGQRPPPRRPPEQARANAEPGLREAFAERERQEQREREAQRRAAEQEARQRKQQRAQLKELLAAHPPLNDAQGEIARNFEWARKIRRIYLTPVQHKAVNAGELGVVALDGRFLLLPAAVVRAAAQIDGASLGLLVDPLQPASEPEYDDPRFQVPDDLIW